jgi:hypothetical protein
VAGVARKTVEGTITAAREVGADAGQLATQAAEGAIEAADRIGSAAGRAVRDAVSGTISGVKMVAKTTLPDGAARSGPAAPRPVTPPARSAARRRSTRGKRQAASRSGRYPKRLWGDILAKDMIKYICVMPRMGSGNPVRGRAQRLRDLPGGWWAAWAALFPSETTRCAFRAPDESRGPANVLAGGDKAVHPLLETSSGTCVVRGRRMSRSRSSWTGPC